MGDGMPEAWTKREYPGTFVSRATRKGTGYVQLDAPIDTGKGSEPVSYLTWTGKSNVVYAEYSAELEISRGARVRVTPRMASRIFAIAGDAGNPGQ